VQPLVSLVTPVYNAEKYLAESIESVLAQTYSNWEYVIVNNCSADRSLEIACSYAQRDARIRVHNNDVFLNQIQNLNHSLRQISTESKYCKEVHADDWLFPDCLSRMVEVAEAHPTVGLVGSYRMNEDRVDLDGLPYPSTVVSGREICRLTLLGRLYVFGSPTSLLRRSDLVRNSPAFYDEHVIQADKKSCFEILQTADFGFVHQVLTFTRRHNESMTARIHQLQTRRVGRLLYLKAYGPVFLSPQEYAERLRRELASYYAFLGQSIFELREKDFWAYHKSELADLGHPLRRARLIKASCSALLNFRDAAGALREALARRKQPGQAEREGDWRTTLGSIYARENGRDNYG